MSEQEWKPIETAPDLDRVLVAGWQPQHRRTAGYWWWAEDVTADGAAIEHPDATLWCPVIKPPFPTPPSPDLSSRDTNNVG